MNFTDIKTKIKNVKSSVSDSLDNKTIKTESGNEFTYKKKRGFLSLNERRSISGWLFVLPFVIGIILIYAPIIVNSIKESFSFVDAATGTYRFVGFENYKYIFTKHAWFHITIVDAMKDLILQIPAIVIFSLFMAIILNQEMRGRAVFRAIFFIPVILSTGVIDSVSKGFDSMENMGAAGGVDNNTDSETSGIVSALDIERLLGGIKLGSGLTEFVTDLVNGIFDIVSRSGVQMLIFLSGLQSISPSIYESCKMEGASSWEIFWKITLPMISPMILVNSIYTIIDAFTKSDNRVMQIIQDARAGKDINTSELSNYGIASAEAWVYLLLVLALIIVVALIMKTVVFYQRRD